MTAFKILGISVILSLPIALTALAQDADIPLPQQQFLGEWVNVDAMTGGPTKLNVKKEDKSWSIEGWGKCSPTDCEWGSVVLNLVGSSIGDESFEYGFAVWEFGDISTYLTLKLDGNQLVVEKIDVYNDDSNRSNKRKLHLFKKA